jgi:hypothetical protein
VARTGQSTFAGEILHTVGVRYRVTGSGNLQTFLRSLDDVRNVQLANISMSATTNREPTILANFQEQRVQLELKTTVMNEVFTISKIVLFVKPVAETYPIGV